MGTVRWEEDEGFFSTSSLGASPSPPGSTFPPPRAVAGRHPALSFHRGRSGVTSTLCERHSYPLIPDPPHQSLCLLRSSPRTVGAHRTAQAGAVTGTFTHTGGQRRGGSGWAGPSPPVPPSPSSLPTARAALPSPSSIRPYHTQFCSFSH